MSSYWSAYKSYEAMQNQTALMIGALGLLLTVGWILIDHNIPGRFRGPVRFLYIALGAALILYSTGLGS